MIALATGLERAPPAPLQDWSNNLAGWSSSTPMDNDERQLDQVKMIKDDPATADYTKVWIYRNSVYGYPWFTEVRKILDNPEYAPCKAELLYLLVVVLFYFPWGGGRCSARAGG